MEPSKASRAKPPAACPRLIRVMTLSTEQNTQVAM